MNTDRGAVGQVLNSEVLLALASSVLLFWATTATAAMQTLYFTPGATSCTKGYSACVGVKLGNKGVPSYCCYAVIGPLQEALG